ncbi:MAG: hypothetical protein ACK5P7_12375 [Bdellovibrio sp.]
MSATIGPYFSRTNFEGSSSGAYTPYFGGLGIMALGDINDRASLELAWFTMPKVYVRQKGGLYLAEQIQTTQITMGYRQWLSSYLSAGLSFYSSYSIGDIKTVHSDFPKGQEIDTSASDKTEYGFDFSVQGQLWSDGFVTCILDGRYSLSVTSKEKENADHFGLFLALRYMVKEK